MTSPAENFKLSIESIYGIKTPNLFFNLLTEQFYQNDDLIQIDEDDRTIIVNTPEEIKIFPFKLFPYWETECYRTERGTYAIRKLTESEERYFLGVNYEDE
jgi:hypothetical protein